MQLRRSALGAKAGICASGRALRSAHRVRDPRGSFERALERARRPFLGRTLLVARSVTPPWASRVVFLAFAFLAAHVPLATRAPWLPAALCQIVEKALAKDPKDRFVSAHEMRAALLHFQE